MYGKGSMERKRRLKLSDIISSVCTLYKAEGETAVYLDNGWCVYSLEKEITSETICYIDDYPDFDDDDNEVYSDYIVNQNMKLIYRDEIIQDVVIACLKQKNNATIDEIMRALFYYEKYDNFLVL